MLLLGALCAIGPLSIDMYLPGAAFMAQEFGAEKSTIQGSVVSYLLGLVCGQLLYGPLSDHYGRKPPLSLGLTLYSFSSIACSLAPDAVSFISWRFMQGLGACAGMVIARAVIRDCTETVGAARAFSRLMLVVSAAPLLAPLLGALLLGYWGWRVLFILMALFGTLCWLAMWQWMRETHPMDKTRSFSWQRIASCYLHLFNDRNFMVFTLCNGLLQGGIYAFIAGSAQVLIDRYGLSPAHYSWAFAANSAGLILSAQINTVLIGKFDLDRIIGNGLWLPTVLGLVAAALNFDLGLPALLAWAFLYHASIGLVAPNAAALALAGHARNAGTASALMGTLLFACGSMSGIATAVLYHDPVQALVCVMAICGLGATLIYYLFARIKRKPPKNSD